MRNFKFISFLLIGFLSVVALDSRAMSPPTSPSAIEQATYSDILSSVPVPVSLVAINALPEMELLPSVKEGFSFSTPELAAPQTFDSRSCRPPDRYRSASPLLYNNYSIRKSLAFACTRLYYRQC